VDGSVNEDVLLLEEVLDGVNEEVLLLEESVLIGSALVGVTP